MKKKDAKPLVLSEWRQWRDEETRSAPGAPLLFYSDLRKRRPELLSFTHSGDKYQVIAGWVQSDRSIAA
jgi:hypothetical protein